MQEVTIIIPNQNQKINENIINQENKSIINVDIINFDETVHEEHKDNNYFDSNEFAIKYLSSSLNSFIRLDNHLVAKVRFQNNCFTDSYSQALDLYCNDNYSNSNIHPKSYLVTEIIKEEKEREGETPLKRNKKNDKNKHKNNFNISNEENEINNRMARKRAYSKKIRNNVLNKNINNDFGIHKIINIDKSLNISKSCKKLKNNDNLRLTNRNCGCTHKNNNNNFERKTLCNLNTKNNLNNSFNMFTKNNKIKNCNLKITKTLTTIKSSKNIVKNEKLFQKLYTSKSNLNIFNKNITKIKNNNINNLNISMNNIHEKLKESNKMRKSKTVKRIINTSNDKQYKKFNNAKIYQNKNMVLQKNPTMGTLTFIQKTNINKKENSKIQKNNDNDYINKIFSKKINKNENDTLSHTKSYINIKKITNINNNINMTNSMPIKKKTNKILKKVLITDKKIKNLKLNNSYYYLNSQKI